MSFASGALKNRYFALAILTITLMGASLVTQSLGSLAPFLATALTINRAQLGLIAGMIGVSSIFISPTAGVLVDRFGERRAIVLSGMLMGVVLFAAAAIENYVWLLFWMAMYGVLLCFSAPAGGRAVILWFVRDRGFAMGIRQAGVPVGGFVGAVLLAPIAAQAGYRMSLATAGLIVIASTATVAFLRGNPERAPVQKQRFRHLWTQMRLIARDPRFILISLAQIVHSAAQSCTLAFLSISLIATAHMSVSGAIFAFALAQMGSIAGRFLWGLISDYVLGGDRMLPIACACAIATVADIFVASHYSAPSPPIAALLYTCAFLLGFSISGCNGLFAVAQTEVAGPENAGSALGVTFSRASLAWALAPPLFGLLADARGYSAAWLTLAALTLVGIIPALAARRLLKTRI